MIYVSVISHNHYDQIINGLRPHLWGGFHERISVVILSNTKERKLADYCFREKLSYIENDTPKGFGENNNKVFEELNRRHEISPQDIFVCVNPDVKVGATELTRLENIILAHDIKLSAPNLVNSNGNSEDNIRHFPTLFSCVTRFLFGSGNTNIDKSKISEIVEIDWAAGAFLCFQAGTFRRLGGFDERYFMYYEDVDICYRAKKLGVPTCYIPNVHAIHDCRKASRKMFSKHFFWHVTSAARFLMKFEWL